MKKKEKKSDQALKYRSSLKNLRIADLDLFITAALLKNLGKAASLHHLSQSAASAAIQRVEVAFGRPSLVNLNCRFSWVHKGRPNATLTR